MPRPKRFRTTFTCGCWVLQAQPELSSLASCMERRTDSRFKVSSSFVEAKWDLPRYPLASASFAFYRWRADSLVLEGDTSSRGCSLGAPSATSPLVATSSLPLLGLLLAKITFLQTWVTTGSCPYFSRYLSRMAMTYGSTTPGRPREAEVVRRESAQCFPPET